MEIFWDVLGIAPTTDTKKIRKAYSALVKVHNPEDDEEAFRKINQAYRAAMKFAANFASLNVSDDQIIITDRREDGSFGVKFINEDGTPKMLPPFPGTVAPSPSREPAGLEDEAEEEPEFDFGDIDLSVVKDYTPSEIEKMAGFITLAPGIAVPDGKTGRKIKRFVDDNDLLKCLGTPVSSDNLEGGREDALYTASLIIGDPEMTGQKQLWRVFFLSPQVTSLATDLVFYTKLEKLINDAKLIPDIMLAITDASPMHPRFYVKTGNPQKPVCIADFISRVPFRFEPGKYPKLDSLMKDEDPGEYVALGDILSKLPVNLYGILMPSLHPMTKESIADAAYAFGYIVSSDQCKELKGNRLMWKMFFKGDLITPIIRNHDLHIAIQGQTLKHKVPLNVLKLIRNEVKKNIRVKIQKKKEDKDWYYLMFPSYPVSAQSKRNVMNTKLSKEQSVIYIIIMIIFFLLMIANMYNLMRG